MVWLCITCGFLFEFDDIAIRIGGAAQCICVRCAYRMREDEHPMPVDLRKAIEVVLAQAP